MGLMAIMEVIKYEGGNDVLVWKHPKEDFNTSTQLIVHETQEAIESLDLLNPYSEASVFDKTEMLLCESSRLRLLVRYKMFRAKYERLKKLWLLKENGLLPLFNCLNETLDSINKVIEGLDMMKTVFVEEI